MATLTMMDEAIQAHMRAMADLFRRSFDDMIAYQIRLDAADGWDVERFPMVAAGDDEGGD